MIRSGLGPSNSVVIFGSGPIGLAVLTAAQAAGARLLVISEARASRRARARQPGGDVVLDPTATDPVAAVESITDGGADVAFEIAGVKASLDQAVRNSRKAGTMTIVSTIEEAIEFQPNNLVRTERTIRGTRGYRSDPLAAREWETTLGYLADGTVDPERFVTARISLDDVVERSFEPLVDPESDHVKIVIEP